MKLSEAIKRLAVDAVDAQSPTDLILGDVVSVSLLVFDSMRMINSSFLKNFLSGQPA